MYEPAALPGPRLSPFVSLGLLLTRLLFGPLLCALLGTLLRLGLLLRLLLLLTRGGLPALLQFGLPLFKSATLRLVGYL